MSTTFDIIIPTYNNADELQRCIEGIARQTFRSFRVLLCIDGESPRVRQLLASLSVAFEYMVLSHPGNAHRGRNATRNLALPHLRAPLLAMLDSDIIPAPTWLEEHYHILKSRDCVSLGDVRYLNAAENPWARYLQSRGKNKYRDGQQIPSYYLATGNLAMPTRYFVAVGGQDEKMYYWGGGDTEFALRLYKAYQLPVIFNARAIGYSYMNKMLAEALEHYRTFGRENLPYIVARHPDERRIFGVEYLRGNRWRDRLLRALALSPLPRLLLRLIPNRLPYLERAIIHFAVFSAIAEGWMTRRFPDSKEVATR